MSVVNYKCSKITNYFGCSEQSIYGAEMSFTIVKHTPKNQFKSIIIKNLK
jgi:hypothetical protein